MMQPPIDFNIPLETRQRLVRDSLAGLVMRLAKAFGEKYGEEGWQLMEGIFAEIGRERAAQLQANLDIDVTDARSLRKIIDFEDHVFGLEGEWVTMEKDRAVKVERVCPLAAPARICPEYCTRLAMAMERGTLDALGAKASITLNEQVMLCKGQESCTAEIRVEY